MPSVPNYRPYCALRDPKQWESLRDLEEPPCETPTKVKVAVNSPTKPN